MALLAFIKHKMLVRRFAKQRLNIIQDLPFERLQKIVKQQIEQGWETYPDYINTGDADNNWACKLRKGTSVLELNWQTNKADKKGGSIIGLERIVKGIGQESDVPVDTTPKQL